MKATPKQKKQLRAMWERQTNEEWDNRAYQEWLEDSLSLILFNEQAISF